MIEGTGIAHCLGPFRVFVHRKADDANIRVLPMNGPRSFDPADPGHADVHKDDIRLEFTGKVDRLLTVLGMADHLEIRFLRQHPGQAVTEERVVIGDTRMTDPGLGAVFRL
jgi:hypothetical protein